MRQYYVTYDYSINGKYYEQSKRVFAKNAKEACELIKQNYWEHVQTYIDRGYSTTSARRQIYWPFHIKAQRM